MAEKQNEAEGFKLNKTKAVIIIIMLVVLVGSLSYAIYLRTSNDDTSDEKVVSLNDEQNSSSDEKNSSSIGDEGAQDSAVAIEDEEGISDEKGEVAGVQFDPSTWKATDYKQGDIEGEKYTVKSGDTLWEIAEARYGSGSDWHRIFDANDIEYLPNGNPLIIPGQVLVLPT